MFFMVHGVESSFGLRRNNWWILLAGMMFLLSLQYMLLDFVYG